MATITIAAQFGPKHAPWRLYQFGGEDKCVNSFRWSFKRLSPGCGKPPNFHEKFSAKKKLKMYCVLVEFLPERKLAPGANFLNHADTADPPLDHARALINRLHYDCRGRFLTR